MDITSKAFLDVLNAFSVAIETARKIIMDAEQEAKSPALFPSRNAQCSPPFKVEHTPSPADPVLVEPAPTHPRGYQIRSVTEGYYAALTNTEIAIKYDLELKQVDRAMIRVLQKIGKHTSMRTPKFAYLNSALVLLATAGTRGMLISDLFDEDGWGESKRDSHRGSITEAANEGSQIEFVPGKSPKRGKHGRPGWVRIVKES